MRDRTRVWGEGPENASLVLMGEAPGKDEDEQGRPFVGAAGRTLNWGLAQSALYRAGLGVINFLSCRPPDNEFDSDEGIAAQRCCRGGFEEELEHLRRSGMRVLVPLGVNACRMLGLHEPIGKIRGSVYQRDGFVIVPTYHPAHLARMRYASRGAPVDLSTVWIADLKKAKYISGHGWKPPEEHFELAPTIERLEDFVNECCRNHALIAVDIETTGFDPGRSEIVVVGLADSSEHGISVPLIQQGGSAYWTNGELVRAKAALNKIFAQCPLIFQNALFDVPFLRQKGFCVEYKAIQHDTLLLHHAISPELPHNLGFIVSIYGATPYWKGEFLTRTGSILEMDDSKLRTYNLRDCVVLHQILGPMLEDLTETGTFAVYVGESLRLLEPLGLMHERGIQIDQGKLNAYKRKLEHDSAGVTTRLFHTGRLPEGFNLDSGDDLRYFLFGIVPNKFTRLEELQPRVDPKTGKEKKLRTDTKKYAELLKLQAIRDQTHAIYSLRHFHGRSTDTGKMAVDEQGLLSLQLSIQNRAAEIQRLKEPRPEHETELNEIHSLLHWLKDYREFRRLGKLLSTYTHYPVWQDGRVHTRFLPSGTATARLASSDPNLQNIPKKDVEARAPFVPREGHVFLAADYVNLEVWVLALESQDAALLETLRSGVNIHDENTKTLFGVDKGSPKWELARRAAKIFQFGHIQFGGSEREIYEKVILECPELALTFSTFVQAGHRWRAKHPGFTAWARRVQLHALNTRRIEIIGGRIRTVYGAERDILKQALNTPIQGGAAYVVNQAMLRIVDRLRGLRSVFVLQIHDEFVLEVPMDELLRVKHIVKEEMERPINWRGQMISFPTSQAVGNSWAACYRKED